MTHAHRIKVLVLHSDPVARAGLAVAFGTYADLEMQGSPDPLHDGVSPLRCEPEALADVVVADYVNGVAMAKHFARYGNPDASPSVVVIAGIDREWEIRSALEQGVLGYLLAGCALDELAAGVRAVHRGARYMSPQVAARLADSVSLEPLTAREEEVLLLVVEGLCNKAISRRLDIAVGTVKSHLRSTFDKLGVASRTQAVAAVERRGLLGHARQHPDTDRAFASAPMARPAAASAPEIVAR